MEKLKQKSDTLLKHAMRPLISSHNLALGITIGLLVGIIPKFSILPWVIGFCALLLPMNLLAFVIALIAVSVTAPLLDIHFDRLGVYLLTQTWTAGFWAWVTASRYFVWSQMHNTVVTGSVAVGMGVVIPVYFLTRVAANILKPILVVISNNRATRWLTKAPEFVQ